MKRPPAAFSCTFDCYNFFKLGVTSRDVAIATKDLINPAYSATLPRMKIIDAIPKDMLAQFLAWEITSADVAKATGYHAVAIRRAIKRPPRSRQPKNKTALLDARKAFRMGLGHLPPKEIQKLANVSAATADRIRREYRQLKDKK